MAKFRQVGKVLLGAMIAASMAVGCFAGTALANEVQPRTTIDQAYVFTFGWYGHQGYSGIAVKEDTTPTYVRAAVMDMPHVYLSVEGFDVESDFWYNRTCDTYAILTQAIWQASPDKKFWIHSNVYEYNGYTAC